MKRVGNRPMIGQTASALGVRAPVDIQPDAEGNVYPNTGGMSVAPNGRFLPFFRIPRRLRDQVPDARGDNNLACFRIGEGPFEDGRLTDDLAVRIDKEKHGLVEPFGMVSLHQYREALAATQDQWVFDEE